MRKAAAARGAGSDVAGDAQRAWRRFVILAPMLWLACFFALPFLILLKISVAKATLAMPPFTPLFGGAGDEGPWLRASLDNFRFLLQDSLYASAYLNSLRLAAITTVACLLLGLPMALAIARSSPRWRGLLLFAVVLPFWTSFLLRVYAWMGLLASEGPVNTVLRFLGLSDGPLAVLYTQAALLLGMVYTYLPFMVLPLYANLERHDQRLLEAAADLGASASQRFIRITLPLAVPGILAGCMLVFIPAVGEFVIPTLLGGPDALMIGRVLWDEFFTNRDWPVAAALAIVLALLLVLPLVLLQLRLMPGREHVS